MESNKLSNESYYKIEAAYKELNNYQKKYPIFIIGIPFCFNFELLLSYDNLLLKGVIYEKRL